MAQRFPSAQPPQNAVQSPQRYPAPPVPQLRQYAGPNFPVSRPNTFISYLSMYTLWATTTLFWGQALLVMFYNQAQTIRFWGLAYPKMTHLLGLCLAFRNVVCKMLKIHWVGLASVIIAGQTHIQSRPRINSFNWIYPTLVKSLQFLILMYQTNNYSLSAITIYS